MLFCFGTTKIAEFLNIPRAQIKDLLQAERVICSRESGFSSG